MTTTSTTCLCPFLCAEHPREVVHLYDGTPAFRCGLAVAQGVAGTTYTNEATCPACLAKMGDAAPPLVSGVDAVAAPAEHRTSVICGRCAHTYNPWTEYQPLTRGYCPVCGEAAPDPSPRTVGTVPAPVSAPGKSIPVETPASQQIATPERQGAEDVPLSEARTTRVRQSVAAAARDGDGQESPSAVPSHVVAQRGDASGSPAKAALGAAVPAPGAGEGAFPLAALARGEKWRRHAWLPGRWTERMSAAPLEVLMRGDHGETRTACAVDFADMLATDWEPLPSPAPRPRVAEMVEEQFEGNTALWLTQSDVAKFTGRVVTAHQEEIRRALDAGHGALNALDRAEAAMLGESPKGP